jgi:UPF0716 protein FxsA
MRPVKVIAYGLLLLPLAEVLAFLLVSTLVGFPAALVFLILVSVSGIIVLRRVGTRSVSRLRRSAMGGRFRSFVVEDSGFGPALAGVFLLVPGFVTGALGALLLFRASRRGLTALLRRHWASRRRPDHSGVLDLEPDEWKSLPTSQDPRHQWDQT